MDVLTKTTERIPFVEDRLVDFFPGFEASLNGIDVQAHVDTGGTFLHMGVERARRYGIGLSKGGKGRHGAQEVDTYHGMADKFSLGPIEMANVPIVALPSLTDQQDYVIFGTNVLQHFVPTLDYPGRMMVLRPKDQSSYQVEDFARGSVSVPFRILGDHYMIAKGGIGDQHDLDFFIDSGLVSLHSNTDGKLTQAAFIAARSDLTDWRVDLSNVLPSGAIQLSQDLSLGPLSQSGHIILAPEQSVLSHVDSEEIHGLLSHAFLSRYVWTIDFEAGLFHFRE